MFGNKARGGLAPTKLTSSGEPGTSNGSVVPAAATHQPEKGRVSDVGAHLWEDKAGIDAMRAKNLVKSRVKLQNIFRPMHWWRQDPAAANMARRPIPERKTHRNLNVLAMRAKNWLSAKSLPPPSAKTGAGYAPQPGEKVHV
jgi:hypothetical protein